MRPLLNYFDHLLTYVHLDFYSKSYTVMPNHPVLRCGLRTKLPSAIAKLKGFVYVQNNDHKRETSH